MEGVCRPRSKWDVLNELDEGRCDRTAPHWYLASRPDVPTRSAAACALGGPHGTPRPPTSTPGGPCWRSGSRFDVGNVKKNRRQLFLPSRRRPLGYSSERCCRGQPAPVRAHLAGPVFFLSGHRPATPGLSRPRSTAPWSAMRGSVILRRRCYRRPGESNYTQPAHGTRAHEHGPGSVYAQLDRDAWGNRRRQQNQLRGQRGLRVSRRVGFFRWEARPGHRTDGDEGNQVNVRTEAA